MDIMIANGHKQPDEKSALNFLAALPKASILKVFQLYTHISFAYERNEAKSCDIISKCVSWVLHIVGVVVCTGRAAPSYRGDTRARAHVASGREEQCCAQTSL